MEITNDILYVGVNDHLVDLFEGQYDVPNGMAYNSYLILRRQGCRHGIPSMPTSPTNGSPRSPAALGERTPDYFVVQHMEPDHLVRWPRSRRPTPARPSLPPHRPST